MAHKKGDTLYYVSTPQGDSRVMDLDTAEEYYQSNVDSLWVRDCDKKKITLHKTTVVKQHTIDGTELPLSFY